MRRKKLLYGVNSKCAQCTEKCRQYKQVKVVYCPFFNSTVCNTESEIPSNQEKSPNIRRKGHNLKPDTLGIVTICKGTFKHKKERNNGKYVKYRYSPVTRG